MRALDTANGWFLFHQRSIARFDLYVITTTAVQTTTVTAAYSRRDAAAFAWDTFAMLQEYVD
jgi:hypothetical protein